MTLFDVSWHCLIQRSLKNKRANIAIIQLRTEHPNLLLALKCSPLWISRWIQNRARGLNSKKSFSPKPILLFLCILRVGQEMGDCWVDHLFGTHSNVSLPRAISRGAASEQWSNPKTTWALITLTPCGPASSRPKCWADFLEMSGIARGSWKWQTIREDPLEAPQNTPLLWTRNMRRCPVSSRSRNMWR